MIGQTLHNRYRLDNELGRGGMGVVYRAEDTLLNRAVAVKLLSATGLGTAGKVRLLAEARAAAKLNHPNIVTVHDAGEVDDNPFIVMELVAGESLRHFQPDSLDDTLHISRQICLALEHAHAHGIIHRDLKPDNVVRTSEGTAKLMDFGLARTADAPHLTEEGAIMGTFAYMAPELIQGQSATVQSDLYALGIMLYEWLTGRPPFTGDNMMALMMQHLQAPVVPPSQHQPTVPASLDELVMQLLSKQPEARPSSATAVREVIDSLSGAADKGVMTWFISARQQIRHNLPRQLTSFVGRVKQIANLQQLLLNPQNRLVTLTGPGGTGKTRLSLETAGTLLDAFANGVWLVELAPLADPALVVSAVATVFELREEEGRPLATILADYLQAKQLLLILDNCEHLIETCARLAESWLESCPRLTILASSREALVIPGEIPVRVPPLAVPDPHQLPNLETLSEVEAVQLFVERARVALPDFTLTEQNGTAVAQVCQRLDGIPLALELAAARVKVLQVEQIAQRLDDRFRLLTGGSRTALPRQRTLQATIDWSYDLLPQAEQQLLQRLSVFAGGWTLEAAEGVCADEAIREYEILDLLTQLVNKSLVLVEREPGQESRYHLLETIRQYAQEKLLPAGNGKTFRDRHLDYFLQLAETAEPELRRTDQLLWLDRLELELDNLRTALAWSLENPYGDQELGLRLAMALVRFWSLRSYLGEAWRWLDMVLERRHHAALPVRARLLLNAGWLRLEEWGSDPAALLEEGLALYRQLDDKKGIAWSLHGLGFKAALKHELVAATSLLSDGLTLAGQVNDKHLLTDLYIGLALLALEKDDYGQVTELFARGLALTKETGDRHTKSRLLDIRGWSLQQQRDYAQATTFYLEALALVRELKSRFRESSILNSLGEVARVQRAYEQATVFYSESLALSREVGSKPGIAVALNNLGLTALGRDDRLQARLLFRESMALAQEMKQKNLSLWNVWGLARVDLAEGQTRRAAQLLTARELGMEIEHLDSVDQDDYKRDVALARTELGEEAFAAAWATGQAMSLEEAVALALEM